MSKIQLGNVINHIIAKIAEAFRLYVFEVDIDSSTSTALSEFKDKIEEIKSRLDKLVKEEVSIIDKILLRLPKSTWSFNSGRFLSAKNLILKSKKLIDELNTSTEEEINILDELKEGNSQDKEAFREVHMDRKNQIHELYEKYMIVLTAAV